MLASGWARSWLPRLTNEGDSEASGPDGPLFEPSDRSSSAARAGYLLRDVADGAPEIQEEVDSRRDADTVSDPE